MFRRYESVVNITCWPNKFQEPYFLVRRNSNITLFYEPLINYGFNKITYAEKLRMNGRGTEKRYENNG